MRERKNKELMYWENFLFLLMPVLVLHRVPVNASERRCDGNVAQKYKLLQMSEPYFHLLLPFFKWSFIVFDKLYMKYLNSHLWMKKKAVLVQHGSVCTSYWTTTGCECVSFYWKRRWLCLQF